MDAPGIWVIKHSHKHGEDLYIQFSEKKAVEHGNGLAREILEENGCSESDFDLDGQELYNAVWADSSWKEGISVEICYLSDAQIKEFIKAARRLQTIEKNKAKQKKQDQAAQTPSGD